MSRIILSVKEIHSFADKGMSEESLKTRLSKDNDYRHSLAKKYAVKHKLHNGATLEFPADGYRNHNLLFWDAQNNEIVPPFDEIDEYGSVPPRFVVGDGYFEPNDWLQEVEHNSYVFPATPLIKEMKDSLVSATKSTKDFRIALFALGAAAGAVARVAAAARPEPRARPRVEPALRAH